jgi:hypothetical protein
MKRPCPGEIIRVKEEGMKDQERLLSKQFPFFELSEELKEGLLHGDDGGSLEGVGPGEYIAIGKVSLDSIDQGCDDAIRAGGYLAGFDAFKRALNRLFLSQFDFFQEFVEDCAARHSDGTFDDDDILTFGIDVCLFEICRCIAFISGYEEGSELDSGSSKFHDIVDVFTGINAAGSDYGDFPVVFFLKDLNFLYNCGYQVFE